MLFLQLLLLVILLSGGDNKNDFQEPVSFQLIQISSFYNHSLEENLGSGWLGELQTHGWVRNSDTTIFLWPWSKGNVSNEEWRDLEDLLHMFSIGFLQIFHNSASQRQLEYPFEVQLAGGCELHFGKASVGFLYGLLIKDRIS
ncbi:hypothetical protein HPG69_006380 [Diceros bicornis minor]|uniref:MHC class I-like antigen recognition-like domain-containing protein n=1 Tax=Diceros bicornis minor TaxID=77932 RepID=A0A7J7EWB5_DICBM|nr:hypothetical protein HPG69_006380 [Diceros bicornis minor]